MMLMRIFDILGKKSPANILMFFLENPDSEAKIKDVIKSTKLAKLSVLRWTKELAKYGILSRRTEGKMIFYTLNKRNSAVKQMKIFYNIDSINSKIGKLDDDVQIFIYGSFARGEDGKKSDIDMLVIGKNRDIISKLKSVDTRIKVSFYTPVEWSMAARKDKAFFDNVEKDKIRIR